MGNRFRSPFKKLALGLAFPLAINLNVCIVLFLSLSVTPGRDEFHRIYPLYYAMRVTLHPPN
jgi:hypothetical protein